MSLISTSLVCDIERTPRLCQVQISSLASLSLFIYVSYAYLLYYKKLPVRGEYKTKQTKKKRGAEKTGGETKREANMRKNWKRKNNGAQRNKQNNGYNKKYSEEKFPKNSGERFEINK